MKVWFDDYSFRPFILMKKKESDNITNNCIIDISEKDYQDYQEVTKKFMEWQNKINDLSYKNLPKGIHLGRI